MKSYLKKKYKSKKGIIYNFMRLSIWFHENDVSIIRQIIKIYKEI